MHSGKALKHMELEIESLRSVVDALMEENHNLKKALSPVTEKEKPYDPESYRNVIPGW